MTIANPLYLQNKLYPAKSDRQFVGDVFGLERIRDQLSLVPSAAGGMGVAVSAGACYVQGDTNAYQGLYRFWSDASGTLTHAAADGTNPRIDRIIARVYDSTEVGTGPDSATIEIVQGTPQSGALLTDPGTWPALPATAMEIAAVVISAGDATIATADILDRRPRLSGKSIIATEEARTNTAYGLLTTPDRVQNIVLPTDGLIVVGYMAMWKESVVGAIRAALYVGANAVSAALGGEDTAVAAEALIPSIGGPVANTYTPLGTYAGGLVSSLTSLGAYAHTPPQVVGASHRGATAAGEQGKIPGTSDLYGVCHIFAAAGTYDISVQFKASSGSVTAKERKLWVWTIDPGGPHGGRW